MPPLHWLPCCTLSQFTITMFKKSSLIGWNILSRGEKTWKHQTIQRQYTLIRSRCHGTLYCKVLFLCYGIWLWWCWTDVWSSLRQKVCARGQFLRQLCGVLPNIWSRWTMICSSWKWAFKISQPKKEHMISVVIRCLWSTLCTLFNWLPQWKRHF